MNYLRLLAGLLCAILPSIGMRAYSQTVWTLDDIFERAETNSMQLRPSFSAQDEADKEISVAKNGRLPDINASLSVGYIGNGFTTRRDFSDYQSAPIPHLSTGLSINIHQPLYTGGAVTAGIKLAELKSTATRFATELQRDNIRMQLTGFYLDLYKCHNLGKVVRGNILSAEQVLKDMKARHEQGTVLQNDITRYELLLSNFQLQLVKLDNTLSILNDNLVTVAGLPRGTVVLPDTTILNRSLPLSGEDFWQKEALNNSSSLRLAQNTFDICRQAENVTKAERLPKVGIQGGWTLDGPITVEIPPINRNLSYWWIGLGVSYNLSSLFKTGKSMAKKRAATIHASDQFDATRENIELTVRADYIKYLEAYEELKTQQKSVELAVRNYNVTYTRYMADMALLTDMLDAANSRLDAEQQLVNARINIIYYYYKLLFISGKI